MNPTSTSQNLPRIGVTEANAANEPCVTSAEDSEAKLTKYQQNEANLLYLQNRENILSRDQLATKGSNYSQRLMEISEQDEQPYDSREEFDIERCLDSHTQCSLSPMPVRGGTSSSKGSDKMLKSKPQLQPVGDTDILRQCEDEIFKVSQLTEEMKASTSGFSIAVLENFFDRIDDIKLILDSLDVDDSLIARKRLLWERAMTLSKEIERIADVVNS